MEPFKKTHYQGAVSAVYAATETSRSGQYICPPAVQESGSKQSQDEQLAEDLMELTKSVIMCKTTHDSVEKGCPFSMA